MLGTVRLRILIVDDNEHFLEIASASLEREGLDVVGTARTRTEAIQRAEETRPDLVLADIGLGSESGFDVARELVGIDGSHTRVLLISTRLEEDFSELIETSPAIGFLPKSELSAETIHTLLRRNDEAEGA